MAVRCTKCGEEKPSSEFYKDSRKRNGLKSNCKACALAATSRWRDANRVHVRDYDRERYANDRAYWRSRYERAREGALALVGEACTHCGSTEGLEVDHVNGDGWAHRRTLGVAAGFGFYRWLIANGGPDADHPLQLLCAPCHRRKSVDNAAGRDRDPATGRFLAGVS